jgi:hypothetical protein
LFIDCNVTRRSGPAIETDATNEGQVAALAIASDEKDRRAGRAC